MSHAVFGQHSSAAVFSARCWARAESGPSLIGAFRKNAIPGQQWAAATSERGSLWASPQSGHSANVGSRLSTASISALTSSDPRSASPVRQGRPARRANASSAGDWGYWPPNLDYVAIVARRRLSAHPWTRATSLRLHLPAFPRVLTSDPRSAGAYARAVARRPNACLDLGPLAPFELRDVPRIGYLGTIDRHAVRRWSCRQRRAGPAAVHIRPRRPASTLTGTRTSSAICAPSPTLEIVGAVPRSIARL